MNKRTLSTLPISVGTGLAIEALAQTPMASYSSLIFNIRTLFRNALGSFDGEKLPGEKELFEAVSEDMMGIATAINSLKFNTHLNLIFYQPSYKGIRQAFPWAKLKIPGEVKMTPHQIAVEALRKKVTEKILDKFSKVVIKTNVGLPSFNGNALVMTHHPVDLAVSSAYSRLNLLESHTGVIKGFPEFNSKLTGGSELTNIPLNKLTIQVFGDRATNFYSLPQGVKNEIKALADARNWSTASTPSYCEMTIRGLSRSAEKEILLKLIK